MKKVLALVLALTLVLGMSTMAMAASKKIAKPDEDVPVLEFVTPVKDEYRAGDDIILRFVDTDGARGASVLEFNDDANTTVQISEITTSLLSNSRFTVKKTATKGGDLIDNVSFAKVDGEVVVKVELVDEFVSVKEKDFDLKINLYFENKKIQEYQISGTMGFEVLDLHDGDDYVDLREGDVAKAHDYLRGVEVSLGEGVTMKVNMFSGKSYYGTANQKVTGSDLVVLNQYPEIETVYYLNTVNLSGSGNIVRFDIDDTYYVYNANGEYIGTTVEQLPYSSKYYMAKTRITMVEDTAVTEPVEPDESADDGDDTGAPEAPDMGGDDDGFTGNVNDNPGTGANGMVNVAMVAGMIALAAAGAVALKK